MSATFSGTLSTRKKLMFESGIIRTPSWHDRRKAKAELEDIESYWDLVKPNPDRLVEPPKKKYKDLCPKDLALVAVYENKGLVLQFIGDSLDYLWEECRLDYEFDLCELPNGIYIWEGTLHVVQDYYGDYDEFLKGDFRLATKEEWVAHTKEEYPWDTSLWYAEVA